MNFVVKILQILLILNFCEATVHAAGQVTGLASALVVDNKGATFIVKTSKETIVNGQKKIITEDINLYLPKVNSIGANAENVLAAATASYCGVIINYDINVGNEKIITKIEINPHVKIAIDEPSNASPDKPPKKPEQNPLEYVRAVRELHKPSKPTLDPDAAIVTLDIVNKHKKRYITVTYRIMRKDVIHSESSIPVGPKSERNVLTESGFNSRDYDIVITEAKWTNP